jgi:sugar O-acyltransferase (sialic acid O-acetyltransferase NeuD family)
MQSVLAGTERLAVVLIGGGGHASCLAEIIGGNPRMSLVGYVAPERSRLSELDVPYLGSDDHRDELASRGLRHAVLGLGGAAENERRRQVFEEWRAAGFRFVDVVHSGAIVSPRAITGEGLQVLAAAVVNIGACLGANVIVNSNATVEHDCRIDDHAHIAPGATLCGGVVIGQGTLVGAGAVIIPGVCVGQDVVIGAGSVVTRHVADRERIGGVPARALARPAAESRAPAGG